MLLRYSKKILLGVVVFSLVGCYIPINRKHFQAHYSAGLKAMDQGDLMGARRNLGRAVSDAETGHMKPAVRADVHYHYARVLGNLCEYIRAEKEFLRARKMTREIPGDEGAFKRFHVNAELARLNYDTGKFLRALPFYEEAIPLAAEFPGKLTHSPVFSQLLEDFSDALKQTGDAQKAEIVRKRMENLPIRNHAMEGQGGHIHPRYPRKCEGSVDKSIGHKHDQH